MFRFQAGLIACLLGFIMLVYPSLIMLAEPPASHERAGVVSGPF